MKTTITSFCAAIVLSVAVFHARADILAGPVTNPVNGHDYYLLTPNSWTASEAEAENLGGTLAVINNAAEQEWVFSQFGADDGASRNLWLGFHREPSARFASMTGEKMTYFNWGPGQPDNGGGQESCIQIWANASWDGKGYWNDAVDWTSCNGVVEVSGKSNEKTLTEKEKALVGIWYHNGNPDQRCWIAGTDNMIFAINNENQDASRIICTPEGFLFSPKWKQHAEIVKDKLLWSNGVWWSRKPAEYAAGGKSLDKGTPELPSGSMTD